MSDSGRRTRGVIVCGKSEIVEWEISDFFFLIDSCSNGEYFKSPPFSAVGCMWNLHVYPKGDTEDNYVSFFLKKDSVSAEKKVTYALGLKQVKGILEEKHALITHTFQKGDSIAWGWKKFLAINELEMMKAILTKAGIVTFTCRIEAGETNEEDVGERKSSSEGKPGEVRLMSLETLSSEFRDLFVSQKKCDITVIVQGKEFHAHRAVLMARSSVFRAMYEHKTSEDETGLLTIPDCDPDTFGDFLKYLYSGKLEEVTFAKVYHLYYTSEKYNVQDLKNFCVAFMKGNMTVENFGDVMTLAEQYDDNELQYAAQTFFNEKYKAIILTPEWEAMMKNHYRLANKLLVGMVSTV